jgi:cytochrome c peroxidase
MGAMAPDGGRIRTRPWPRWPTDRAKRASAHRRRLSVAAVLLAFAAGLLALAAGLHAQATLGSRARPAVAAGAEPITPVPPDVPLAADKVALGERLFHDVRLSRGDAMACASCHRLAEGGDDNLARSPGIHGKLLDFNTPTVFNAALSFRLNWRGNFRSLQEQIEAVLYDPDLMNTSWEELLPKLRADASYREAFDAIYGSAPEPPHVLDALATFERSLITPDAPFDRYLRGERDALERDAERGYELFKVYGCTACHQGVNVGGNLFQKFGIFQDPFAGAAALSEADLGRFTITGKDADRHVFRVPSLRNVALTAPYFHDGDVASLEEAVESMARSQLGRSLSAQEIDLIVAFLRSLTGAYRGRPLAPDAGRSP